MSIFSPKPNKISNSHSKSLYNSSFPSAAKIPKTSTATLPPLFPDSSNARGAGVFGYDHIQKSLQWRINQHRSPNEVRWSNAATDAAFRAGVFAGSRGATPENVTIKSRFSLSQIDVKCGAVCGYQTENRKTYKLDPLLPKYARAAEQHNRIQTYLIQRGAILDKISGAFAACVNEGACISEPNIENSDKTFKLRMKTWKSCDYIIDANYRENDGSDCTYIATSEYLERDQTDFYYPWIPEHLRCGGAVSYTRGPFYFQPQNINGQVGYLNQIVKLWQRRPIEMRYWVGQVTGRKIPMSREDIFQTIEGDEPWEEEVSLVNGWYRETYCNGVLVAREDSPYGETTPFTMFYWKFNPHIMAMDKRIISMVRQLKDPQYISDVVLNMSLDSLYSRMNGGILYKEGSITDTSVLTDPSNVRNLSYRGDVPPTFIASNVIPEQNIMMGQQILQMLNSGSPINLPVNPEGMKTDSGLKTMLQQGAQLVGLSPYMAELDRSVKHWGRLCLYSVLNYMPIKLAEEIVGEPLDPFFWSISEENCELTPSLGILTDTQAKETYVQYMEMFKEVGIQPTLEVLKEIATTPEKEKIFGMLIEARDGQAKAAQMQMQIEEELAKAQVSKINAEAIAQLSRAKEAEGRASSYAGLHAEHAIQAKKGNADSAVAYSTAVKNIAEMLAMFDEKSIERATEIVEAIAAADEESTLDEDMSSLDRELGATTNLFESIKGNQENQNVDQGQI
jgi:hypothetical protein